MKTQSTEWSEAMLEDKSEIKINSNFEETDQLSHVSTVTVDHDLNNLRVFWEQVQNHPQVDFAFFHHKLRWNKDVVKPYVASCYRKDELVSLLVGRVMHAPLGLHFGYKLLKMPRVRMLEIVQGGLMGEDSRQACEALLMQVRAGLTQGEASVAVFRNLPKDSMMYDVIQGRIGSLQQSIQPALTWNVSLSGSHTDFMQSLGKSTRAKAAQYGNLLKKKYGEAVNVICLRSSHDIDQILSDTEKIAVKTWQRGVDKGFVINEETIIRYEMALSRQLLRAYFLYLQGVPVAFWHGVRYKDTFFAEYTGYDPSYHNDRPGAYLLNRMIEQLCEEKTVRRLDFGEGDHEYKRRYCHQGIEVADVYVYCSTVNGLVLKAIKTGFDTIKADTKKFLRDVAILDRTRKMWRTRLGKR